MMSEITFEAGMSMRCTKCGMIFEAGKSYGYACPHGNVCSLMPIMPREPVTLLPIVGTRDAELTLTARIIAAETRGREQGLREAAEKVLDWGDLDAEGNEPHIAADILEDASDLANAILARIRHAPPAEERLDRLVWYASPDPGDFFGLPYSGLYHVFSAGGMWYCSGPGFRSEHTSQQAATECADAHFAAAGTAPSAPVSSPWQDIATAPKDGTRILAFWPGVFSQAETWFGPMGAGGFSCWQSAYEYGGRDDDPTHWMPLPPAPADGGDNG